VKGIETKTPLFRETKYMIIDYKLKKTFSNISNLTAFSYENLRNFN